MIRRPPRSTRTDTLFPYTTLFRSLPVIYGCKGCCTSFTGGHTRNSSTGSIRHSPLSDFWPETRPVSIAFMRSEEHTSELQSLMRISYAVFCLKKKQQNADLKTFSRIPCVAI